MPGFELSLEVNAPGEAIWEVVSNVASWPSWHPRVSRCEALTPGPVGVGSRYLETATIGADTHDLEIAIRQFEPGHRLVTGGYPEPGRNVQGTWELERAGEGVTRVTRRVEWFGQEGERLYPERQAALREQNRLAIEALKRHVEGEAAGRR